MGRGNWSSTRPAKDYNKDTFGSEVYVEVVNLEEDHHDDFLVSEAYDTLYEVIRDALPYTFDQVPQNERSSRFGLGGGFREDTRVIFCNSHVLVTMDAQGETYHQGIGVVVNPTAYHYSYGPLAERTAALTYKKLERALRLAYPKHVSFRTSAWTSARFEPLDEQKAA